MIGKKIVWPSFIISFIIIALSVFFRMREEYMLSNVLFASALIAFLIFSWIQRRIKEDMLLFISEEYREKEWRYYFTSLISFILLIFATMLNVFIIFLGMNLSRVIVNILFGVVLLLMLYTVFSIPSVEKTAAYSIFLLFAFIFSLIVIGSQLDIGYHLPENVSPIILNMADPLFLINIALISWMASLMAARRMGEGITMARSFGGREMKDGRTKR